MSKHTKKELDIKFYVLGILFIGLLLAAPYLSYISITGKAAKSTCVDSDANLPSLEYLKEKGTCTDSKGTFTDTESIRFSNGVMEYYCSLTPLLEAGELCQWAEHDCSELGPGYIYGDGNCILAGLSRSSPAEPGTYWHSRDHYEVELDGEGDAIVVAIMEFEGISPKSISQITLEIPNTDIRIFSIASSFYYDTRQVTFLNYTTERLADSTKLVINLQYPTIAGQKTTILITYQAKDIAKKVSQGLEFRFETIKDSNAIIRNVGANVIVPDEMSLKGKPKKDVQYKPSAFGGLLAAQSSEALSRYVSEFYYRQADFNSKNLDPGESFIVTGLYGDNFFLMYILELLAVIIIAILLFLLSPRIVRAVRPAFQVQKSRLQQDQGHSIARPLIMGLVTGVGFVLGYYISTALFGFINYSAPNFPALYLLFLAVGAFLTLLPLLYPAYYMKKRHGMGEAIATFIVGIFIAFIILFVLAQF